MTCQDSRKEKDFVDNLFNMVSKGYFPTIRNKCTECHTMNPVDGKFCRSCGSSRIVLFHDYIVPDIKRGFGGLF